VCEVYGHWDSHLPNFLILREGFINQFKLQNKSQISYVMWKRNLLINNIGMCHNITQQLWNNVTYPVIQTYCITVSLPILWFIIHNIKIDLRIYLKNILGIGTEINGVLKLNRKFINNFVYDCFRNGFFVWCQIFSIN